MTAQVDTGAEMKLEGCNNYELVGVLDHRGETVNSGHYVTKVKSGTEQWVLCNDTNVTDTPFGDVISGDNYLLLYKKKETQKTSNIPEFIPTDEWQEVQPGQSVPAPFHIRMAVDGSGKKWAKIDRSRQNISQKRGTNSRNTDQNDQSKKQQSVDSFSDSFSVQNKQNKLPTGTKEMSDSFSVQNNQNTHQNSDQNDQSRKQQGVDSFTVLPIEEEQNRLDFLDPRSIDDILGDGLRDDVQEEEPVVQEEEPDNQGEASEKLKRRGRKRSEGEASSVPPEKRRRKAEVS